MFNAIRVKIRVVLFKVVDYKHVRGILHNCSTHIGHIERGTRTPSIDALCAISSALGVSLDSLLLDSFDSTDKLTHLAAALKGKDPEKVRRFVAMVTAMAEKIDEI